MATGIILGLASAFSWGLADFCARLAAHRVGHFRTLFYMQFVGLIGLGLWLGLFEGLPAWNWGLVGLTVILALLNTLADLSLYHAFEIGVLSVVSPIASSYSAPILVLSLLTGHRPGLAQLLGFLVTMVGVGLASAPLDLHHLRQSYKVGPGVGLALVACGCFGLAFWGLGLVTPDLGGVFPAWETRIVGPLLVLGLVVPTGQNLRWPPLQTWPLIGAVGLFDTGGLLFYNFGVRGTETSLVAVVSSLFSAVTVLLARLFLSEKMAVNQWLGVGFILAGVALLSL